MTAPAAAGFPAAADSVLAPVLVGLQSSVDPLDLLRLAWTSAAQSLPDTRPILNVVLDRGAKPQQITHTRQILSGSSTSYPQVGRLCDMRPQEKVADSWPRWRWEVGACVVTDRTLTALVPDADAVLRLDVTQYRLTAGQVQQAVELALFRHYLVSGLQAIATDVVVTGGLHDWHDEWWPEAPTTVSR